MKEWKLTKIKHLCKKVCSGGTPKSTIDEYYGGGIPWLNTKEVNFNRIYSTTSTISELGLANSSAKWIDAHSVIVAMYGATAAKCAIAMVPLTTNQACCNLIINDRIADYRFVYYALTNSYSALASLANGGAQQNLSAQLIKEFELPLPDLQIQRKIANILSSIDDKIELNTRINHNLEEQAQALYKSWFVDFEPFKNGKFVDSELGLIPEGWRVATLGEVTSEMRDKVGTRQDVKVLSPVTTGQLVLSEEFFTKQVFSESIAKYLIVRPNDFAYNPARVNIGSLGKNEFDFDGCVSPVYVVFRCETGYEHFFNLYRSSNTFKEEVISRSNGGVRQTLGYKDFALIKLVYPPVSVVEEYNAIYCHMLMGIRQRKKESIVLANQRDELLPNLMTGKIPFDDLTC